MSSENNKRIAKNTLLLYFRMLLTMLVSLFTVRVILSTLGALDYGIYYVVGGVVGMFALLSNTMASASQRFFAFDLGKNDYNQLKKTFALTVTIYLIIALVIIILAETVGLWFLNHKMVIPPNRLLAANWIYQFTIFSFVVGIVTIPYNAVIIARENMKVYAYVSIIEVTLKLLIVYLLVLFSFDKLKLYGFLMFATSCLISSVYIIISKRKYEECKFQFYWEKKLFKTLISYSGWNLFGSLAGVFNNEGINILLNIFFGPIVNTARGIAFQVSTSVNQFVSNFITAVNPQITKYYAANEKEQMTKLVFQSSKLSFYLLFILSMPVLLETNFILTLWLKQTPDYVIIFTRLVIIAALIDSLSYPLMTAAQATGNIKRYQTVVGSMMLLNLPISYCFLKLGFPPQVTMVIAIVISFICLFLRLLMLRRMIGLVFKDFINQVLVRIFFVNLVGYIVPIWLVLLLEDNLSRFLIVGTCGLITSIGAIYLIGLSMNDRLLLNSFLKKKSSTNTL